MQESVNQQTKRSTYIVSVSFLTATATTKGRAPKERCEKNGVREQRSLDDRTIFLCRILHDFSVQNRRHITSTITALTHKIAPCSPFVCSHYSIVVLVVVVVAATNTVKLFNVSRRGALDCRHGKFLSGCLLHKLIHSKKKELETGKAAFSISCRDTGLHKWH
jgi:hypothetical protein